MADSLRIKMTDERKLLMDKVKAIVAADPSDDPPKSKVFDAALTHLIESGESAGRSGRVSATDSEGLL